MNEILHKNIEDLELSVRCINALKKDGINLVSELIKIPPLLITKLPHVGKKQLTEIEGAFARHGLELGTPVRAERPTAKIDLDADFILQAYAKDYICIDGVYKVSNNKRMLACFTTFRDYNDPEEHLREILNLRDSLLAVYAFYPDGDVTVELTIKDELVNA